jgi:hypothetical protein
LLSSRLTSPGADKFEADDDGIKIISLAKQEEIIATAGFLGTKGKLLMSLMEKKKNESGL